MAIVQNPFQQWNDPLKGGRVIFSAQIYVGQPDTDPTIPANQLQVFYINENQQRINLTQPLTTDSGGYIVISDTNSKKVQAEVDESNYSVTVKNRDGADQWVIPNAAEVGPVVQVKHNDTTDRSAVGAHDEIYPRLKAVSEVAAEDAPIGTHYKLEDIIEQPVYVVVESSDTGGLYHDLSFNNKKLRLVINTGYVYVEWLGARQDEECGAIHNTLADYCRANNLELRARSGGVYKTNTEVNFRSIRNIDYKAQLIGTSDFITITLGGDSNNVQQYYKQSVYRANRGGDSPAIRIVGSNKNKITIAEASIIEVYADTDSTLNGTDEYCAYNTINIQSCTTLRFNSNPSSDGSVIQWINKNDFNLQFIQNFEAIDNGYRHNGNHFYGGNFEASNSKIDFQTGIGNIFHNVRGENALAITFGENATNNVVLTDWFDSPNNPAAGATVTDNGLNNTVKNLTDINNDRVTMLSFNGASLIDNGAGSSNFFGVNASLVKDPIANTVTASANQRIYQSPYIEVNPSREYFFVEVEPKLSGGIRMEIIGWDENMNGLASTGKDVFYQGATNEEAGFGENNTTITNRASQRRIHIMNKNTRYIRITVNASSAGVSFRRFTLGAITGDKVGKQRLMAAAQIFNI